MPGFVLTPDGIKPLDETATPPGGIVRAADFVANLKSSAASVAASRAVVAPAPSPTRAKSERIKRRQYARELRARLSVVEREIKTLRQLEEERDDIKRLLAALKALPATVTDIQSARKSG